MAKIVVKNLNKYYDNGFHAVKDVNFVAEDKEFVVLVGPSGCGKSTILRLIAGLEEISSGDIYIGEKLVNKMPPKERDIAMVFQNYALYPHMTVENNMAFALKLRGENKAEIAKKVDNAAEMLGIESMLKRKPGQLSGGQRQRVALGRAIVRNPKVFLFDEPLSNLDAKLRVAMRAEIVKLHRTLENTMIYVTHDQVEAMTMADRIVVMKDGIIHQIDTPLNIYNNPANMFVAGFIGSPAINIIKGKLARKDAALCFDSGDFCLKLTQDQASKLEKYIDKEIVMGIRPEDIYDARHDSMAEAPQPFNPICDLVEPLGNEFHVVLKTKSFSFVARLDPKDLPQVGKELPVSADMHKAHFFDPESEISLY
ncbi:MAG: sn-glycerol-3-phosphate ABC transporter ATP-binding protein UgpC [Candidatus Cloacimonetes bacterium]|jgi:multiple sugar transport system ATP-binding protein|nr:sn-glycerol-3-phosphate ABC transporter ATP-binding protein UgpC [Candidatus Cloacimonadota bacterium]MDY0337138.1 sn-glycerol-3-phosphate ABC transporter ATP-binding protein UgpC [Candidatus Cloacimonadaceae bacterium]MCB5268833.1 sn-glycerol-3-phosphate ABC transporter ATP-binding protein UgpC [Candidatus Cloacimonadota bacterium]MCK9334579.1 sn-glycerol-3-phosphate ABC transporter ATP-binding protein UgpC [Candidatus Cloacimonadota bacterium]MDD2544125.1 sn-glycerol-3-phosphate ABC transp